MLRGPFYILSNMQRHVQKMNNEGLVIQKDRNWYATTSKD